jgi:uncharacterized glyoxalase superfamily protein PhnB
MARTKRPAKKTAKTSARKTAPKRPAKAAAAAPPRPRTLTPYLAVSDAAAAIEWYKKAFGAKEVTRQPAGDKIMHAALRIGDSDLYLADIFPGSDLADPSRVGASVNLHLELKDADKVWQTAVTNGAKVSMPLDDMFWGQRYGKLVDPFGHNWALSSKSKLSKAELEKKREQAMREMGGA